MAPNRQVAGEERLKAKLFLYGKDKLQRIADAVEASAVVVANHAKANHGKALSALHGRKGLVVPTNVAKRAAFMQKTFAGSGRYQNRTNVLTSSITPKLVTANEKEIVAEVFTTTGYSFFVEVTHPFLFPALHESRDDFKSRVIQAML